jgi:hypothetical protein
MDEWLLSALATGKLLPYGYKLPRDPADTPVRLPVDVHRFVDAGNSTIKGAGLEFASVRIIRASLVKTLERQFPPAAVPARREPGRPSVQPLIAEAICELYEEGRLSYGESQKGRLRLIGARARQKYPDRFPHDRTPSDDTIRSTLKCMEELNSESAPRKMWPKN